MMHGQCEVLIVGSTENWAIENYYCKYLTNLGLNIRVFDPSDFYSTSTFLTRLRNKLKDLSIFRNVNKSLIQFCQINKPKIVWVFKGIEIYPKTLVHLKSLGIVIMNYNPDHPFIISSLGSGNKSVTSSVNLYDLHFCYHSKLQQELQLNYNLPTVFLPFGFELTHNEYNIACQQKEITRICFLGNPDKIRIQTIALISKAGYAVDIYGHGWNKTSLKYLLNVNINDAVYGIEFWCKLRQYRIQLNIFRPHNIASHNMRTFEIPAVGGIQLSPFSDEQSDFFSDGKEIFFYLNQEEMIEKIKYIYSLPLLELEAIRHSARERSITSGYQYFDRAKIVYNTFKSFL